jgi:hypothetical protein
VDIKQKNRIYNYQYMALVNFVINMKDLSSGVKTFWQTPSLF